MNQRILFLAACLAASTAAQAQVPLFASDEPIAITIEAPIRDLVRNRSKMPEYDGTVTFAGPSGDPVSLPVKVSSRGKSRLESCDFPPIRLEFKRKETAGTVFEGQKRLKLVTQCGRGASKETWLHQEYGIYRAYNQVTDASYRVRMLDVTYQDSESERWNRQSAAFVIEATGQMADRLGMTSVRPPKVEPAQFDLAEATNNALFQYLIGNTDFSLTRGPTGEGCCHNGRVIGEKGSSDGWIVVPYDFDQAGIINTDYSMPSEQLPIKRVTARLYRGFCWQNDELENTIERFNSRREEIYAAFIPEGVSGGKARRATRFIDRFYETINDPEELEDELTAKCRGGASFEIRETSTPSR